MHIHDYIYIYIKHDNGQELQKTLRFLMTEHKVILTKKKIRLTYPQIQLFVINKNKNSN